MSLECTGNSSTILYYPPSTSLFYKYIYTFTTFEREEMRLSFALGSKAFGCQIRRRFCFAAWRVKSRARRNACPATTGETTSERTRFHTSNSRLSTLSFILVSVSIVFQFFSSSSFCVDVSVRAKTDFFPIALGNTEK